MPPSSVRPPKSSTRTSWRRREDPTRGRGPRGGTLAAGGASFIVGGDTPKFVGAPSLIDRAMVTLATNRGLMLVGEPGTAKSLLSELLAAADQRRLDAHHPGRRRAPPRTRSSTRWNYALLVAEGPTPRALVPAPLLPGMARGSIVRFEEITRCPLEVQDALLSVLSDRVLAVPELHRRRRHGVRPRRASTSSPPPTPATAASTR